jgi:FAD/FMN-containing dehydrogenase
MNKVAHYLQDHLLGEVMDSGDARKYFSTDNSIFSITPTLAVYPFNEEDVRKTARFSWQLAERGRIIPITARGSGTDQTGAAIGEGIILVFPAHLNRVVEYDGKTGVVVVEPGINYGKLQQTLYTHNRFLPPYPASIEYSTLGGAVANNAGGEKSIKYGDTRAFVKGLRVVLANGEVIDTGPLNKRELSKKLGQTNFEGEIYRSMDALIEENQDLIKGFDLDVSRNSAGYHLSSVKNKKDFDLTPLIVGSQGTLGIVTEIILDTEVHNPGTTLVAGFFDDLQSVQEAVLELKRLPQIPSAIEMVDETLLNLVDKLNPNLLKSAISKPFPKFVLFVEFDDSNDRTQKRVAKRAKKIFEKFASKNQTETKEEQKDQLWKIRQATSVVLNHSEGGLRPLPLIEDGIVPVTKLAEYTKGLYELFQKNRLQIAIWGHAGEGNLHVQPFMDLSQVGDRQRVFRLMEEYYDMVISLGGSTSGGHNDGRLRAAYLSKLYGEDSYDLFKKVKKIFDPYNILNPGVKVDVTVEDMKGLLRHEYANDNYTHMPRS